VAALHRARIGAVFVVITVVALFTVLEDDAIAAALDQALPNLTRVRTDGTKGLVVGARLGVFIASITLFVLGDDAIATSSVGTVRVAAVAIL